MQEVAEFLCDDWAAARNGSGLDVARGLASVAAWLDGHAPSVPLAGMAEHPSQLLARVTRLLERGADEVERLRPWHVGGMALLLLMTVLVAPGVRAAPERLGAGRRPAQDARSALRRRGAPAADPDDGRRPVAGPRAPRGAPTSRAAGPGLRRPRPPPTSSRDARPGQTTRPAGARCLRRRPASQPGAGRPSRGLGAVDAHRADWGCWLSPGAPPVLLRRFADPRRCRPFRRCPAVAPVPPRPPRPPAPPGAPLSAAEIERIRRDAQRMARDAQRRAHDAAQAHGQVETGGAPRAHAGRPEDGGCADLRAQGRRPGSAPGRGGVARPHRRRPRGGATDRTAQ